jgi:hypothetical protein
MPVAPHHLLTLVRDVRTHGGKPSHRWEDLGCLAVFGRIAILRHLIQKAPPEFFTLLIVIYKLRSLFQN